MAITVAPSAEACQAIVDRINAGSGGQYTLPTPTTYAYDSLPDVAEEQGLRVEVIHVTEQDLDETLDLEQRTSHELRVWIRQQCVDQTVATINDFKLLTRRIVLQLKNYRTSRIHVWECNPEAEEQPDKAQLRISVLSASIALRVEVEP